MIGRGALLTIAGLIVSAGVFPGKVQAQEESRRAQLLAPDSAAFLGSPDAPADEALAPAPEPAPGKCQLQDRNGTLLWGYPLLDPPPTLPGWFASLEVEVVKPEIPNQSLNGQVMLGGAATEVSLHTATFNWTGAPRLEVGYRLPAGVGEVAVSYRPLFSEGSGTIPGFDAAGAGALKSRVEAHMVFLDYTSREFSLWPHADMKAYVGVCLPSIFFDAQAVGALRQERVSNSYFGAGPHLGFDFWEHLPVQGLDLYSRMEGVLTEGYLHQTFEEDLVSPGSPAVGGDSSLRRVREVPGVGLEVGLGYTVPWPGKHLHFLAGVTVEHWWYVAQTYNTDNPSRGELGTEGVFLRAEWGF